MLTFQIMNLASCIIVRDLRSLSALVIYILNV